MSDHSDKGVWCMSERVVFISCHGQKIHPAVKALSIKVVLLRPEGFDRISVAPEACPYSNGPQDDECGAANWYGQKRTYPLTRCPFHFEAHVGDVPAESPCELHSALRELAGAP